jgi:hypothetical protein
MHKTQACPASSLWNGSGFELIKTEAAVPAGQDLGHIAQLRSSRQVNGPPDLQAEETQNDGAH